MNILIAANYATPQSGNFVGSLYELGIEARRQGHELFFVFPEHPNTLREGNWVDWLRNAGYVVRLVDKAKSDQAQLEELEAMIREYRIDILHTHFSMYRHPITHSLHKLPVKVLFHEHFGIGWGREMLKTSLRNCLISIYYRLKGINVVFVSEQAAKTFPFARRWCVPNAVSMKRNIARSLGREECREELGVRPDEKLCLFLGWSLHTKGLDVALKAIEECRRKDPSVVLGVVGLGRTPKDRVVQFVRQHTEIDPAAPWIRYFPDTEDMFAYHRAADVYLSASRTEGFSYGLLESISQSNPVAVSDIAGTKWAKAYDHAFFYPVEDASACADAILKALSAGRENSNAQQIAEFYHVGKWCDSILDIYNQIKGK